MSGQNNDADSKIRNWSARVDLTSRDLQTGTVQLPGRLQDLPPPGALEASAAESATDYLLELHEPRALHGLSDYFADQGLRPNDTITLSLQGNRLTLQAIKRQRRRQQKRSADSAPPVPLDAPPPEPDLEAPTMAEEAELETPPPASSAETAAGSSLPEPDQPEAAPEPAVPDPGIELPDPPADAFSDFARADDLNPFDELDDLDGLEFSETSHHADLPEYQEPASEVTLESEAAITQSETEPLSSAGQAELPDAAEAEGFEPPAQATSKPEPAPATAGSAAFHTLPRRPFRSQVNAIPSAPQQAHDAPAATPAVSQQEQALEEPVAAPAEKLGAAERLDAYLAAPTVPAIIQVTKLAAELQLDAAELADALRAKASEPTARLSSIRPDYYLYKRPTE